METFIEPIVLYSLFPVIYHKTENNRWIHIIVVQQEENGATVKAVRAPLRKLAALLQRPNLRIILQREYVNATKSLLKFYLKKSSISKSAHTKRWFSGC